MAFIAQGRVLPSLLNKHNKYVANMKLHLPTILRAAVLAAVAGMGGSYATDMYTQPTFTKNDGTTGPEYTWVNGHWVNSGGTQANPGRADSKGPLLVVNDAGTATNSVSIPDTSDYGGIKVTGNSNFTTALGGWAGSIYVGEGSALSASYSVDLKSTEPTSAATVYVDGRLTITGRDNLSMNDGNNYQNWYIGKDGFINLSQISSVNKGGRNWNMQLNLSGTSDVDIDSYTNRTMGEGGSITKEFMSTGADLYSQVNTWTVFREGVELDASNYTINHTASGMSVTYTGMSIQKMSLTWAGGEDTWEEKGTHWTDSQGTVTSFASGDDVTFNGTGNKANVSGGVMAGTVTVAADASLTVDTSAEGASLMATTLSLGSGSSFTLAAGSVASVGNVTGDGLLDVGTGSSLTISATQNSFSRLVTGENGALHLNMDGNTNAGGNSTIVLAEGSTIKDVYVDSGCFAVNMNGGAPVSNLRGANLHLNGVTYVVRNGVGNREFAPSEKVYLSGDNTLQVYGSVGSGSVLTADFIQEEGKSASLRRSDGGTITVKGDIKIDKFYIGGGNTILADGNETVIGQLRLSEQGGGTLTVNEGSRLEITGSTNNRSTSDSLLLAHWGQNSTLHIDGGEMVASGANALVSWDGTGTLKVTAGTATLRGIDLQAHNNSGRGSVLLGDANSGSGRINLGAGGIKFVKGDANVKLGEGTIGATADWTTAEGEKKISLIGAVNGTVFDTADPSDSTQGHTVTISTGFTGDGKLVKMGEGALVLSGESDYTGGSTVTGGTLSATNAGALGTEGAIAVSGGTLEIGAAMNLGDRVNQTGGTISVTEAGNLTLGASTINAAITNAGTVALSNTIADAIAADAGSGDYIYMGLNGVETTETGNYFLGTQATTVTIVTGEGTASGTVSYNDKVYTLAENGKITTEDTAVDYTTFFMQTDSLAVTSIAAVSTAHEATLDTVEVNGGTLSVDANVANVVANGGTVSIAEGSSVTGILEVAENATVNGAIDAGKVTIDAGKTATMTDGVSTSGVTIGGTAGATVQNTGSEEAAYSLADANAKVTAENLTASSAQAVAVNNKLVVDSIVNEGTGTLTVTGMEGNLTDLVAKDGSITLQNVEQPLQVSNLNLGAEHAVSIYTGADAQTEGAIKVTGNLTSAAGSDLYANLLIGDGATLTLNNDALTLHSQITVEGKFTVAGTKAQDISSLAEGSTLTFIDGTALTYAVDYNGQDAASYLTNVQAGQYEMVANGTTFGIKKTGSSPVVPEPTTGTLSLLALAGLMARRRRK